MKKGILSLGFVMQLFWLSAQIKLPAYAVGTYQCDTLLPYMCPINDLTGRVHLSDGLTTSLLTGVKFYLQAALLGPEGNKIPNTIIDSSGVQVPIRSGYKYEIPTEFKSLDYVLQWYVVLGGTPTVQGESYFCDLWFLLPLKKAVIPEEIYIKKRSEKKCVVDGPQRINVTDAAAMIVYPNPVTDQLIIQSPNQGVSSEYTLFNGLGEVLLKGQLQRSVTTLDLSGFPAGMYYLRTGKENAQVIKVIKK
jgi:hypothetical protein